MTTSPLSPRADSRAPTRESGTERPDAGAIELDATYEPFSREAEYVQVNRAFVESLPLVSSRRILDLSCGTGTMTGLILDVLGNSRPAPSGSRRATDAPTVSGIDISAESLGLARSYLAELPSAGATTVSLVRASGDCLPLPGLSVDAVVIGNAIQLFENKDRLMAEIGRVVRPGGTVGFNTSFYAGAYLPGTERFYLQWVEEALRWLRRVDQPGGVPRRVRRSARPAFSNRWLSPEEYASLLLRHGFHVGGVTERTVMLTRRSFESIGAYAGLASVLLSGYPHARACAALQAAAGPALEASGLESIARGWLEVVGTRRMVLS